MELAIELFRIMLPLAVLVVASGIEAWSGRGYGLVLLALVALGIDLWATSNIQRIDALHGGFGYDLTEALWFFVETIYTGLVGVIGFTFAAVAHQRGWGFTQLGALAFVGLTLFLPLVLPSSLTLTLLGGGTPLQMAARGPYLLVLCVPLAVCLAFGIRRMLLPRAGQTAPIMPTLPTDPDAASRVP